MPCDKPAEPLPEPLRGKESGTFTHLSIVDRLPEIGRRMVSENSFNSAVTAKLDQLFSEIPHGPIRSLLNDSADAAQWQQYIVPYLGQNWLEPPWFFVEHYFYRRVLEATGYFESGPGRGLDPFQNQKQQGLLSSAEAIEGLGHQLTAILPRSDWNDEDLAWLLALDLWGNQADLSMWPEGKTGHANQPDRSTFTLVDDTNDVIAFVRSNGGVNAQIDILIDNAGFELVVDLLTVLFFLEKNIAGRVKLHAKAHPTFVSDAMIGDVWQTLTFFSDSDDPVLANIGSRLASLVNSGRLVLTTHSFWTSPLPSWEMPESLCDTLGQATLVISKGDAHYRRLLGDRHWPYHTYIGAILCYLPAPILVLRTLKSEVAAGITTSRLERVQQADPNWLVSGQWGMIQFVPDLYEASSS
jgi:uncharacterized protein with ATP-grasp and redox domains